MTIHTFLHMRLYLRKNAAQYLKPVNTGSVWVTITKNTGGNLLTLSLRAMFGSQGPSTYIQYFIMYSIPYSKVVQSTLSVYSFDDQKRYRVASTPVLLPDKKTHFGRQIYPLVIHRLYICAELKQHLSSTCAVLSKF